MPQTQKNIVIYGAGWAHNIGNAFIQFGSRYSVEQVLPQSHVHILDANRFDPPLSATLKALVEVTKHVPLPFLRAPIDAAYSRAHASQVKLSSLVAIDAVILSGVWLTAKYLRAHRTDLLGFRQRGIPVILNGVSGTHYHAEEQEEVTQLLREIQPFAVISRDQPSFDLYRGACERMFSGMDVGFFVRDAYPHVLPLQRRTVVCFDRGPLPAGLPLTTDTILTHHTLAALRYSMREGATFMSELPEDYLHLYASADTVYSDRVHACVAALSYGNAACLMDRTPRAALFDRVGAGDLRTHPVRLDPSLLAERKEEHITFLRGIFRELGWTD